MALNKFGMNEFRAKDAQTALEIISKQCPNGVASKYVFFGVYETQTKDKYKDTIWHKYHTITAESRLGGAPIVINISKKTANELVQEYGIPYTKSYLYDNKF